jgi:sugar lactone lactonase YvrE
MEGPGLRPPELREPPVPGDAHPTVLSFASRRVGAIAVVAAGLLAGCSQTRPPATPAIRQSSAFQAVAIVDGPYVESRLNAAGSRVAGRDASFQPVSFCLGPAGMMVIADRGAGRLLMLPAPAADSAASTAAALETSAISNPGCVRLDPIGNAYTCGSRGDRLEIFDPRLRAAGKIDLPAEDQGLATGRAVGIAFGPLGDIVVADEGNARVDCFNAAGRYESGFDGGESVPWGRLVRPAGIAVHPDGGSLYVCDPGVRRVVIFDREGIPLRSLSFDGAFDPVAVAVDHRAQVFVADRGGKRIVIFGTDDRVLTTIDESMPGQPWVEPSDLAVDGSLVWVSDPGAGRIVALRPVLSDSSRAKSREAEGLEPEAR